PLYGG
ncbi:sensory box protein, partial [Vibrio parahaemolyticus VP2007-007]